MRRLVTIWTMDYIPMLERISRTRDWSFMKAATKLPKRIKYYVTVQQLAQVAGKGVELPVSTVEEILRNVDVPKNMRL